MLKTKPRLLTDVRVRRREPKIARKTVRKSSLGSSLTLFFLAILMVFTIYAILELFNAGTTYAAQEPSEPAGTIAIVTAYTSSVDETDDTPFITASGERTKRGVLACPKKYEFGTKVLIEGRQYTCADRMNQRYRDKECFDIWVETKSEAFDWGRRTLEVKILG